MPMLVQRVSSRPSRLFVEGDAIRFRSFRTPNPTLRSTVSWVRPDIGNAHAAQGANEMDGRGCTMALALFSEPHRCYKSRGRAREFEHDGHNERVAVDGPVYNYN